MDQHDPSATLKNLQNMEGAGQILHEILRLAIEQTKADRLNRRSSYPKLGTKKLTQSVHSNQPRAYHSANEINGEQQLI